MLDNLKPPCPISWCPGCGNFGIWAAFKNAAVKRGWDKTNTVLCAGIGCHGHILNYINLPFIEGLHGRAVPLGCGIKTANHKLNVFVFTGDGDCLGEGGNHFIHACRRNHNITIILHDNALYSLTTGQASPTSPKGLKSKSTPQGNLDEPLNPVALAIASGATFVARAYSGDITHLTETIIRANEHQGCAVVDILQPCVTLNKVYTHQFFQANTYQLDVSFDPKDKIKALEKAQEWARLDSARQGEKKIPLGIFYQIDKPSYESQIVQIKEKPLVELSIERNLQELIKKYL